MRCVIKCSGWKKDSTVDGPGIRSVLFVQGCSRHCPGCHNSTTHNPQAGKSMDVEEIFQRIRSSCSYKKITISGGEPLEQPEAVFQLLTKLKKDGFNTCLYTGYNLENVPKDFFPLLNYIKCGHFKRNLADPSLQYYGSTNQTLYKIVAGQPEIYD